MVKVAIIEVDTPTPPVLEAYGSYGDIFTRLLEAGGLDLSKEDVTVEKYNVVEAPENFPSLAPGSPQRPDVVLVTGSRHNSYDSHPWILKLVEFVQQCLGVADSSDETDSKPVKTIGICYGHQIIGRALGSKVGPNPKGWEISNTPIKLTDAGVRIFPEFKETGTINIMEMHRDIVFDEPKALEGVEITAKNEVCEIQGLYKKGYLWSLQGHPEFDKFIEQHLIINRHKVGLFNDELVADGLSRLETPQDGNTIAKSMVRFINE